MVFFELAKKNVTRKRERSILTIVAVLLAIGSFVSLLSVAEGLSAKTKRELGGQGADLYVVAKGVQPVPAAAMGGLGGLGETVDENLAKDLHSQFHDNIDQATPVVRMTENYEGLHRGIAVWGIDIDQLGVFLPHLTLRGTAPHGRHEIAVGEGLANELKLGNDWNVTLGGTQYRVTAVADGGVGFEQFYAYMSVEDAKELGHLGGVHEVWLKLNDASVADNLAQQIMVTHSVTAYTEAQYRGASLEIVQYAWVVQCAIALIGVLISMTAAMNTMLMSTYERFKEFGTLRAIGASRAVVLLMIMTESLILSGIGGTGGVVLGIMGSQILDIAVRTLFRFSFPLAEITFPLIMEGLFLSVAVGLVGAAIPAFLVYHMDIIKALRTE